MADSPPRDDLVRAAVSSYERAVDLQYVQLLLAIVIVILLIYFVGCFFGAIPGTRPGMRFSSTPTAGIPMPAGTGVPAPAKEAFAPYASVLAPDIERSDAQFDSPRPSARATHPSQRVSSENMLFNGIHATQLLTPLV
jgi:hypothetical protein